MLNSVDTKTMIHAGVEIIVIGGVTFWLNKRISGVQDEMSLLQQKVESLESIIQQQNQMISRHESILRQIMGAPQEPEPQQRPPQGYSQGPPQGHSQRPPKYSSKHRHSEPQQDDSSDEGGPQELSPEELDVFLKSELSDIKEERECRGDKCTLKPRRTRKKGRRRKKSHGD